METADIVPKNENSDLLIKFSKSSWPWSYWIQCRKFFDIISSEGQKVTLRCVQCTDRHAFLKATAQSNYSLRRHYARMHPNSMVDFEEARTIKQSNGATYHRPLKKVKVERLQNDDDAFSDEEIFNEDEIIGNLLPLTTGMHPLGSSASISHSTHLTSDTAVNKSSCQDSVDDKFLDFIMDTNLPIDIGENKSMNKMVQFIAGNPNMSLPSSSKVNNILNNKFTKTIELVKEQVANNYLCLTADIWTLNLKSFISISAHWINDCYNRRNALLRCERFRGGQTYDNVNAALDKAQRKFCIAASLVTSVSINNHTQPNPAYDLRYSRLNRGVVASSAGHPSSSEDEDDKWPTPATPTSGPNAPSGPAGPAVGMTNAVILGSRDAHPAFYVCLSHVVANLCQVNSDYCGLEDGQLYESVFHKLDQYWRKANRSRHKALLAEHLREPLVVPQRSPWNSLYAAVDSLLGNDLSPVNRLFDRLQVAPLTASEYAFLADFCRVFDPISRLLDFLQSSESGFYGALIPALLSTRQRLSRLVNLTHCAAYRNKLVEQLNTTFADYVQLKCEPAVIATVTHPYFKFRWLEPGSAASTDSLTEMIYHRLVEMHRADLVKDAAAAAAVRYNDGRDAERFFGYESPPQTDQWTNDALWRELNNYLSDSSTSLSSLAKYPMVSMMFRKYNSTLASSAPVESLFDFASYTADNGKLRDTRFSQYVFLNANRQFTPGHVP